MKLILKVCCLVLVFSLGFSQTFLLADPPPIAGGNRNNTLTGAPPSTFLQAQSTAQNNVNNGNNLNSILGSNAPASSAPNLGAVAPAQNVPTSSQNRSIRPADMMPSEEITYDAFGRVSTVKDTDSSGKYNLTTYSYDNSGRVSQIVYFIDGFMAGYHEGYPYQAGHYRTTVNFTYSGDSKNVKSETVQTSTWGLYGFSDLSNFTKTFNSDGSGFVMTTDSPVDGPRNAAYTFDSAGRLATITLAAANPVLGSGDISTITIQYAVVAGKNQPISFTFTYPPALGLPPSTSSLPADFMTNPAYFSMARYIPLSLNLPATPNTVNSVQFANVTSYFGVEFSYNSFVLSQSTPGAGTETWNMNLSNGIIQAGLPGHTTPVVYKPGDDGYNDQLNSVLNTLHAVLPLTVLQVNGANPVNPSDVGNARGMTANLYQKVYQLQFMFLSFGTSQINIKPGAGNSIVFSDSFDYPNFSYSFTFDVSAGQITNVQITDLLANPPAVLNPLTHPGDWIRAVDRMIAEALNLKKQQTSSLYQQVLQNDADILTATKTKSGIQEANNSNLIFGSNVVEVRYGGFSLDKTTKKITVTDTHGVQTTYDPSDFLHWFAAGQQMVHLAFTGFGEGYDNISAVKMQGIINTALGAEFSIDFTGGGPATAKYANNMIMVSDGGSGYWYVDTLNQIVYMGDFSLDSPSYAKANPAQTAQFLATVQQIHDLTVAFMSFVAPADLPNLKKVSDILRTLY